MNSRLLADMIIAFSKVFIMGTFFPWAFKTILVDPERPSYVFGTVVLALSTYGLWVLVLRISHRFSCWVVEQSRNPTK